MKDIMYSYTGEKFKVLGVEGKLFYVAPFLEYEDDDSCEEFVDEHSAYYVEGSKLFEKPVTDFYEKETKKLQEELQQLRTTYNEIVKATRLSEKDLDKLYTENEQSKKIIRKFIGNSEPLINFLTKGYSCVVQEETEGFYIRRSYSSSSSIELRVSPTGEVTYSSAGIPFSSEEEAESYVYDKIIEYLKSLIQHYKKRGDIYYYHPGRKVDSYYNNGSKKTKEFMSLYYEYKYLEKINTIDQYQEDIEKENKENIARMARIEKLKEETDQYLQKIKELKETV